MPFPRTTPSLYFASEPFKRQCAELLASFDKNRFDFLVAVKSCPIPELLQQALELGVGLDASNAGELDFALRLLTQSWKDGRRNALSITGPSLSGVPGMLEQLFEKYGGVVPGPVSINIESLAQYEMLNKNCSRTWPLALGVRLRWPSVGPREDSRFGFGKGSLSDLDEICNDARFRAFHGHNSLETRTFAHYEAFFRFCSEISDALGCKPSMFNLGGGFRDSEEVLGYSNKIAGFAPSGARIRFEPGKMWTANIGRAYGTVLDIKPASRDKSFFIVLDLSRVCHLRWEQVNWRPKLPGASHATERVALVFCGPTCYEADVIGTYSVARTLDGRIPIATGDIVEFVNVRGYAHSWNVSFNGVPAADVYCT